MSALRKTFVIGAIALAVLLVLLVLLAVGLMSGMAHLVSDWGGPAVVHIDGESFTLGNLGFQHALLAAGAILLAVLIVLVVVPMTLGVVALAVGFALVAALGAPVLALALVAVVLASPVLLVIGLVWLARRVLRTGTPPPTATTINA
jgi:hypothetical protein